VLEVLQELLDHQELLVQQVHKGQQEVRDLWELKVQLELRVLQVVQVVKVQQEEQAQ
jgi:hypothetical protein